MRRRRFLQLAGVVPGLAAAPAASRLKRKDCFFGIHFDLHPNGNDKALGRDVTPEMVGSFLARVKPDYVQYDCKGHVGYLGYPSQVGTSAPGIVRDSLEIWRRVTEERGVSLFIHFSGVWDSLAVERHPGWARVSPEGKPDERQTSTFGPYVDKLMIPQLLEASEKYHLDGAWVDGECWATALDYAPAAAEAFRKATGIAELPIKPGDPGWLEFLELNREQFRRYLRHYVETLHKERPGFQIASNWLYSTYVPERPTLPVDFVSGDYLGNASISRARLEARYLCATGTAWDLMAWGFQSARNNPVGSIHKPAVQLQQEAAVVLAQGGGFQIYYQPTRAGRIDPHHIGVMEKVAEFCRARQSLSHKTEGVPEVAVLFSGRTLYRQSGKLFGGWGEAANPAEGIVDALVENHLSVDVVPDWKLEESIASFPLFVVPEWSDIGDEIRRIVSNYVEMGGRALVLGAANTRLFASALKVRPVGEPRDQTAYLPGGELLANVRGLWQDIEPDGCEVVDSRYPAWDDSREGKPAVVRATLGKGKIAAICGPIGSVFAATHAPAAREFVGRIVRRLFTPRFTVSGPPTLELSLRRKESRMLLHVTNSTAMQVAGNYAALDFVPPLDRISITVRGNAPSQVTWEPKGFPLPPSPVADGWRVTIPRVEIHGIVSWPG